jgi:hypothetical protein
MKMSKTSCTLIDPHDRKTLRRQSRSVRDGRDSLSAFRNGGSEDGRLRQRVVKALRGAALGALQLCGVKLAAIMKPASPSSCSAADASMLAAPCCLTCELALSFRYRYRYPTLTSQTASNQAGEQLLRRLQNNSRGRWLHDGRELHAAKLKCAEGGSSKRLDDPLP